MPETTTKPEENKVTYDLTDLVIFFHGKDDVPEEGISIDSIIKYSRSMNTSTADLYANGGLYYRKVDEKNGDSTMETANLPKAVLARMLGWRIDSKGRLVHVKDAEPARFDMAYSVKGDKYERRKLVYGCEASAPNDENETRGESINYRTEQINITEFGAEHAGERFWDMVIYQNEDPEGFEKSFAEVVYPEPGDATEDEGGEPEEQALDDDDLFDPELDGPGLIDLGE